METVLKTVGARKALVGSNPTPSALISLGVQHIRSRVASPRLHVDATRGSVSRTPSYRTRPLAIG